MTRRAKVAFVPVGAALLILMSTSCLVESHQGSIVVFNETDETIEVRYRDAVLGELEPGDSKYFQPRPAQDVDCLIAPLEILNADGQVVDQVDAGECYDRDIEVRVTDDE